MSATLHQAARRRVALLGIIAVLFQAILFGWHHHPLSLAAPSAQPVVHSVGGGPLTPATADDDCDICAALHHLSAAPGEPVAATTPTLTISAANRPTTFALPARASVRGFHARAPPVIEISA